MTVNTMGYCFLFFYSVSGCIVLVVIFRPWLCRPCRQYPSIVYAISIPFFLFFVSFSGYINYLLYLEITIHIISVLIFLIFPSMFALITIFGNVHRPHQQYPNIVKNSLPHVYSFVPPLPWFSGYIYISYYIWKCPRTISTVPQHSQW